MSTPLAIVGFSFEFPQDAVSEDSFWKMLCEGRAATTDFPSDRINIDGLYHPNGSRNSTIPLRGGNFVKGDLGAFDAPFFSITPGEAACMDPQHRKMLETTYHALEDAGIPLERCAGSDTSVYTGCFTNDYLSILKQDHEADQRHAALGIAPSMLANRLSWFFDFHGTSMNLDSACSSSLVALHLACQDLRAGTTAMAIVGGANLVFHPDFMIMLSNFKFLSPESRSWSFDERANGYARGEGMAVLVVKRLADALRDGDTIRSIIRNTGSNQDGRTQGITQPSQSAQTELIERTYRISNIDMAPTRFFEAHGTGTRVGDPVEANGIGKAFLSCRSASDPLYIGAVKSNIGHLEGASGLAGVIKTILVLEHGIIPPIAGFKNLNHEINAGELHLVFPTEVTAWPTSGLRRACVNSFGFGGTNATIILDDVYHYLQANNLQGHHRTVSLPKSSTELDLRVSERVDGTAYQGCEVLSNGHSNGLQESIRQLLMVWSASDEAAANRLSDDYCRYIIEHKFDNIDLAHALGARRTHLQWRSFLTMTQHGVYSQDIYPTKPSKATDHRRVAFIFTGQGAQYLGMGRKLTDYVVFSESLRIMDTYLRKLNCTWSLSEIIGGSTTDIRLEDPAYSQPLTTCLQIALVDLLKSFNISASVVIGHSSGEIAAAYAAGALSRNAAVKVAYNRGLLSSQLVNQIQDFTMMAVGLSKTDVIPYLERLEDTEGEIGVAIGCVNSPKSITLTGKAKQLTRIATWLEEDSIFARKLRVPIAYHSEFMRPIAEDYRRSLEPLEKGARSNLIPMISSVTGDIITLEDLSNVDYWIRNLTSTVQFDAAFAMLLQAQSIKTTRKQLGRKSAQTLKVTDVLEIGPHSSLQGPIRECLQASTLVQRPVYIPSLIRNENAVTSLLKLAGTLHCAGYPINITEVNGLCNTSRPIPSAMPKYPFNHKQSYWLESRLSMNFRFNKFVRHDLLGTRSLDWNPQIAQWRNVIRLTEMPWLEDHTINSEAIFPAAGMVVMAMEAMKQLASNVDFRGFQIKDITFLHPISFPTGKAETQMNVSVSPQNTMWSRFRLFAVDNDDYIECCNGFIRGITTAEMAPDVPFMNGMGAKEWMDNISAECVGLEQDPYNSSLGSSVRYGPSFRNLEQMRLSGDGDAVAILDTKSWKQGSTNDLTQNFVIHPAVLDGLAQLVVPALSSSKERLPTMVPAYASSIWVDCSHDQELEDKGAKAAAKCRLHGYRGALADLVAISTGSGKPLFYIEGLETTFISGSSESSSITDPRPRPLCTRIVSKLDVEMMSSEQLLFQCNLNRPKEPANTFLQFKSLMTAIMYFVEEAISFLDESPELPMEPHLTAYAGWMRYQQQRLRDGYLACSLSDVQQLFSDEELRSKLLDEVEAFGLYSSFFLHVGRHLKQVLCGEVDPLNLMFKNGLVDHFYEEMLANEHHAYPISVYLELLSFKTPSMSILEIGAGTGGQTLRTLETLASDGVKKWSCYDYTDISPAFFERARERFQGYGSMRFRTCDISKDPVDQGFEAGGYDLVLASHVLHATNQLDESLKNIRKLLKPGGKLLLVETTRPEALHVGFAFGLLKGWWNPLEHEQRSVHSPCIAPDQWDDRLRRTGFSGVDFEIKGQEVAECQYSSIMISTARDSIVSTNGFDHARKIALVVKGQQSEAEARTTAALRAHIPDCEEFTLAELNETKFPASIFLIFLLEVNASFLDGIAASDFGHLKSVLLKSKTNLWITKTDSGGWEPQHHLADGLGRSLMSEDPTYKFVTLALDDFEQDRTVTLISNLVETIASSPIDSLEINYIVSKNKLSISRITENNTMNNRIFAGTLPRQEQELEMHASIPVSLQFRSPGHLDTLEWASAEENCLSRDASLQHGEMLVEVRAIGLSFRDHLIASGQLNEMDMGTECAGIVHAVGKNSEFKPGDRVCAIGSSMIGSLIRIKTIAAAIIPPEMSFVEAAALPTALWLSYHAIYNVARLEKGETILIYDATSCVGQMAIQLAKHLGANVIAMAGSAAKRELLHSNLGLCPHQILMNDDHSLRSSIMQITDGGGIDVVIGALSERDINFSVLLAPYGRLVDISLQAQGSVVVQPGANDNLNISRSRINMASLLNSKQDLFHKTFQNAIKVAFAEKLSRPRPLHIFQAGNAKSAFIHFQEPGAMGKRVIELRPGHPILANVQTTAKYSFASDASYVIAGGLGGLGRNFARWMVSRGARNLILLSRSGPRTEAAQRLICELELKSVTLATPAVDISDMNMLESVLERLAKKMPPIRGCIQATVALRDNLFENMTYEDWSVSTSSKVTGSWNLHRSLPLDLDFFVLLSSVNGIFGNRAQANYAAGNTFKDALAHYRISQGQKAVSIDLGLVVDEGVVAENETLLATIRRIGHLMDIEQSELLAILDHYCNPTLPILSDSEAQVLVGIEVPSAVLAKGIDLHHSIRRPMFRQLFQMDVNQTNVEVTNTTFAGVDKATELKNAATSEEASRLVTDWFSARIGQVLDISAADLDLHKPVHVYGIDSLVAIDLKNWLIKEIGADITVFMLLSNLSLQSLCAVAAEKSRFRN